MLTSLDMHYLTKELQQIKTARISKIYSFADGTGIVFQLHIKNKPKLFLTISPPDFLFLTDEKPATDEELIPFAKILRKHITNATITDIEQINFERILKLTVKKSTTFHLIVELFSKGNIILLDQEQKIIAATLYKKWSTRVIAPGKTYSLPPPSPNIKSIIENELAELIKKTNKDTLVKFLAADLCLGKKYAEEICITLDRNLHPSKINKTAILKELKKLLNKKLSPYVYFKNSTPVEFSPFKLNWLSKQYSTKKTDSLSKAIRLIAEAKKQPKEPKEITRLKRIISNQEKTITELEEKIKLNQEKANLIYQHFNEIKEIISLAKEKRFAELKKDPKVKRINMKEKKVLIEISKS